MEQKFKKRALVRVRCQDLTRKQCIGTHKCAYTCTHTCARTHTCACTHAHIYMPSCTFMHVHVHVHNHTHTHMYNQEHSSRASSCLCVVTVSCQFEDIIVLYWEAPSPWAQTISIPSLIIIFIFLLHELYILMYSLQN